MPHPRRVQTVNVNMNVLRAIQIVEHKLFQIVSIQRIFRMIPTIAAHVEKSVTQMNFAMTARAKNRPVPMHVCQMGHVSTGTTHAARNV